MFVYSAARKGKRMEKLSLKAEETLWLYPCQFQAARLMPATTLIRNTGRV